MRNIERISEMCLLLQKIWTKNPDLRFNQLIHNLQAEFNSRYGEGIKVYSDNGWAVDLFYTEDDKFIEFLYEKVGKKVQNGN